MSQDIPDLPVPSREMVVRGRAHYVDDIVVDDCMSIRFLRSTLASALIESVHRDADRAETLGCQVFLAEDLQIPDMIPPLETSGALRVPRAILAKDRVRFAGEPLAAVVAPSAYVAEDLASEIAVDATPLPIVLDPVAACEAEAVLVHPDLDTNVLYENVFATPDYQESIFERAPHVFERTFHSPRQTALPMETRALLAVPRGNHVEVWSSTQVPHMMAETLCTLLGLTADEVRVRVPSVGGAFGLKAHVYPEEIATVACALRLNRPVKWIEDRADNLSSSCHARDQVLQLRFAADERGKVLAVDADVVVDVGAYGVYAHGHLLEALGTPGMLPGPYDFEAYRYRARAVATNKCPLGAYRGVGMPVATFVHERIMDVLARELRRDQVGVRKLNMIAPESLPRESATGHRYDGGDYPAALEHAAQRIGYPTFEEQRARALADGRVIGLGLASYVEYSGVNSRTFKGRGMVGLAGYDEACVSLDEQSICLWTTLPSAGQSNDETMRRVAARAFGLSVDSVRVMTVDTAKAGLQGNGTFASRSAVSGAVAVEQAAGDLRERVLDDAAATLGCQPEELTLTPGAVVHPRSGRSVSFEQLLSSADSKRYEAIARHDPPEVMYPYGAHACIVEIDPRSGSVRVLRYVVADDCGRRLHPEAVEGQTWGAVAQGLAGALYEELVYDDAGQLQTGSLMDYLVPGAEDLPDIEVINLDTGASGSLSGARGAGESGTLAPGATIANAVSDALGAECNSLPVDPEWAQERASAVLAGRD